MARYDAHGCAGMSVKHIQDRRKAMKEKPRTLILHMEAEKNQ